MKINPMLVIDGNFICHRAKYALQGLSYDGFNTGILLGFLSEVQNLCTMFKTNNVVFVWDSKTSFRKEQHPFYKSGRAKRKKERTKEEIEADKIAYEMFNTIRRKVLPTLGFNNNFLQRGLEGDDLMHIIVQEQHKKQTTRETILVTGDEDMFQSIFPHVKLWNPGKRKMYTEKSFIEEYGITPSQWSLVKCWGGCKSDSVPGLERIGEKKVIQYLRGEMNKETATYQKFVNGKDIFDRNVDLVVLPHKKTKPVKFKQNKFTMGGLKKVLKKYHLQQMRGEESMKRWERIFRGQFSAKEMRKGLFS